MSARADARRAIARLAIVSAVGFAVALSPTAFAADAKPPTAERAKQILEQNRPLAQHGDATAEYNMGVLYDRGYGVPRDYAKARQWYEKAAAQHYPRAEHNLGIMYEAGKGVARDMGRAADWFRRGADDGQASSQNNLAVLYMKGEGLPQNTGKAAFWAARAAAGGNSAAIDNLPRIIADLPHIHVDADEVNVRDQPNRDARVVGHVDSDTVAVVLSHGAQWSQILLPKDYTVGWVANFLLSESQAPLAAEKAPPADDKPVTHASNGAEQNARPDTGAPPRAAGGGANRAAATPVDPPVARQGIKPPDSKPGTTHKARSTETGPEAPRPAATPGSKAAHPAHRLAPASGHGTHATAATKASPKAKPVADKTGRQKSSSAAPAAKTEPKAGTASKTGHATVGVGAANVRARPGSGGRVIGQLPRGADVTLVKEKNGWRYIRTTGGLEGWVAGYLLVIH